jgi:Tfp pilus assembly pilus retraction ATPase PilT
MYDLNDLLQLVANTRAQGLILKPGLSPVVRMHGEQEAVEGPAVTPENAEELFRVASTTRQRRELADRGFVEFVLKHREKVSFKIEAR